MLGVTILSLLLSVPSQLFGANPEDLSEKEQLRLWREFYQREAMSYEFECEGKEFEFREQPVLHWTNPVVPNQIHGAVFIWTKEGRAEVVGSIWSGTSGRLRDKRSLYHQFHSLSLRPFVARRNGQRQWYPKGAGITPKPIPDAPKPAESRSRRMLQMRALARAFAATGVDSKGTQRIYHRLAQPIFQQEKSNPNVIDSALFLFVLGTDPELMLLIEARRTDDDLRWHFAPVRFTDMKLTLKYDDRVVWEEALLRGRSLGPDAYYMKRRISTMQKTPPPAKTSPSILK